MGKIKCEAGILRTAPNPRSAAPSPPSEPRGASAAVCTTTNAMEKSEQAGFSDVSRPRRTVEALTGDNVHPELICPLLHNTQMSAPTPLPDKPATPSATAPQLLPRPKAEDDMWNKRQLSYIFFLGLSVGLLFLVRPFLPNGYDRFLLAGFAMIWGLGSVGLPLGIFGTTRVEKNLSRHIGRLISLFFSLMVIYATYLLAVLPMDAAEVSKAHLSRPPPPQPALGVWELVFGAIGFLVAVGHIASWYMGCHTGGDRDLEPQELGIKTISYIFTVAIRPGACVADLQSMKLKCWRVQPLLLMPQILYRSHMTPHSKPVFLIDLSAQCIPNFLF